MISYSLMITSDTLMSLILFVVVSVAFTDIYLYELDLMHKYHSWLLLTILPLFSCSRWFIWLLWWTIRNYVSIVPLPVHIICSKSPQPLEITKWVCQSIYTQTNSRGKLGDHLQSPGCQSLLNTWHTVWPIDLQPQERAWFMILNVLT